MEPKNPYQTPAKASSPPHAAGTNAGIANTLFSFAGRIPRRTYWLWSILLMIAFGAIVGVIVATMSTTVESASELEAATPQLTSLGGLLIFVLFVPVAWINLALQVKRWHDRDKGGAWVLINCIPLVGGIWSFVECGCLRGTMGPNQFGPDPT